MTIIVQKYGGTSVGSIERIINVAQNIRKTIKDGYQVVVVVSAMSGETDRLISLAKQITKTVNARDLDNLAATGEQVTTSLLSLALQNIGISAKSYCGWQIPIMTSNTFAQARIKSITTKNIITALNDGSVVVVAGFQGVSETNDITTLGRGGSDTSAVALAVALKAHECQIYTDVNGVYTADPNKIPTAQRIKELNGTIMLETASLGAKVLHVRSCELGYRYKTNIRVLSTFAPQDQGSLIMNQSELENYPIISLSTQDQQTLFSVHLDNTINISNIMVEIYKISNIDMLKINQDSLSFVVDGTVSHNIKATLEQVAKSNISIINNLTKISLIGSGFRSNNLLNQQIWQLLGDLEIFAVSHNEISLSILVHSLDTTLASNKLTKMLG